jgi:hypothetical protein
MLNDHADQDDMFEAEQDPYASGVVDQKLAIIKEPVKGRIVGVLANRAVNRQLNLIHSASRAVRMHDIHELMCTVENVPPGGVVQDVSYLAFFVLDESGVIVVDDILQVNGRDFGTVIGFNEIHAPNHINIVILVTTPMTGFQVGWELQMPIQFRRPDI